MQDEYRDERNKVLGFTGAGQDDVEVECSWAYEKMSGWYEVVVDDSLQLTESTLAGQEIVDKFRAGGETTTPIEFRDS
jgi:hypothetical protein